MRICGGHSTTAINLVISFAKNHHKSPHSIFTQLYLPCQLVRPSRTMVLDTEITIALVTTLTAFVISVAGYVAVTEQRNPSLFLQRLLWDDVVQRHRGRKAFKQHLRMTPESFNKLLTYVKADLECNNRMAALRGGAILPEIRLYCTIRWLAGGSYSDIALFCGISKASFYRVVWQTIKAIRNCKELQMKFPQTREECQAAANGFRSRSRGDAITNCVGVIDGFLVKIDTPPKSVVGNVRSYFSGHYQCNGMNIQAVSDHHSRFIYFAVAAPGVMGDNDAIGLVAIKEMIERLPVPFCVIGDAAYVPTEHLISVYHGSNRNTKKYDDFNFFASQLRIRIEMAFGLMVRKWGILWKPLQVNVRDIKHLMLAVALLHNYCINERLAEDPNADPCVENNIHDRVEDVHVVERAAEVEAEALSGVYSQWSVLREKMVERVEALGLERQQLR